MFVSKIMPNINGDCVEIEKKLLDGLFEGDSLSTLLFCNAKLFDGVGGEGVGCGQPFRLGLEAISVSDVTDQNLGAVREPVAVVRKRKRWSMKWCV